MLVIKAFIGILLINFKTKEMKEILRYFIGIRFGVCLAYVIKTGSPFLFFPYFIMLLSVIEILADLIDINNSKDTKK